MSSLPLQSVCEEDKRGHGLSSNPPSAKEAPHIQNSAGCKKERREVASSEPKRSSPSRLKCQPPSWKTKTSPIHGFQALRRGKKKSQAAVVACSGCAPG